MAQHTALDGVQESTLDKALIARLELGPDEAGCRPTCASGAGYRRTWR